MIIEDTREKSKVKLKLGPIHNAGVCKIPARRFNVPEPVPNAVDLLPILKHCLIPRKIDISFTGNLADGELDSYNANYARSFNAWFRVHREDW